MRNNGFCRIVCLLLTVVMIFSVTACAKNETSSKQETLTASQPDTGASENSTGDGVVNNCNPMGVWPIAKETVTLRIMIPAAPNTENLEDNYYTKWLEEKANVKLEFETIPTADLSEKLQLTLASYTDLPDIWFGMQDAGSVFSATNIVRYGENGEGQVLALNDLIEQYGEYTNEFFDRWEENNAKKLMTSSDGNIYYLPYYGPSKINRSSCKFWLNKGWLDALGLEVPTTTEELKAVLEAFRDNDPNGNGKADEIPLIGAATGNENYGYAPYNYLLGSFLSPNPANNYLVVADDGTVEYSPVTDSWREAMKYLNDLCTNNLYSPQTYTTDVATLKQMVNSQDDIVGGFTALGLGQVASANDLDVVSRYVGVVPVAGPDGTQNSVLTIPNPGPAGVISTSCQYPEIAFRLMDLMLSEEASRISRFGVEGEHWEYPNEGDLDAFGDPADITVLENVWNVPQNYHWENKNPVDQHFDMTASPDPLNMTNINSLVAKEYLAYEPDNIVTSLIFTQEENSVVSEVQTNLESYVKETVAKFSVGEYDPNDDAVWERYLKEFEAIGLSEYLEIVQTAYERMNK